MSDAGSKIITASAHQAMATGFSIQIAGWTAKEARQVCHEAFAEVDRLERLLSLFIDGSDVDRINQADAAEPVRVSSDTFACIRTAVEAAAATDGAFDPTAGSPPTVRDGRPDDWRGFQGLRLDPDGRTITKDHPHMRVDLGGIGKGFAVDYVVGFLREWDVPAALVTVGGSTAAAFGRPGLGIWSGQMDGGEFSAEVDLGQCALASSGLAVKGRHILAMPASGYHAPGRVRSWAAAGTAAVADALSTAFFLMPPEAIHALCQDVPEIGAAWINQDDDPAQPPQTAGLLARAVWLPAAGR